MQVERGSGGFHIDLEDFLTGLLLLANELVSLSSAMYHLFGQSYKSTKCNGRLRKFPYFGISALIEETVHIAVRSVFVCMVLLRCCQ